MDQYNPFSLKNKKILVVGASSGIGQATSIECSKLGACVCAVARNESRLRDTVSQMEGNGNSYRAVDITDDEQVAALIASLDDLDGVVLSAGVSMTLPVPFCTKEKFKNLFEVNFFSQVELVRLLYKKKKLREKASVVLVDSIGGTENFTVGKIIYGTSKAALLSAMRYMAKEFAVRKIRVNSVNPGMVNTKLIHNGTISEDQLLKDAQNYPLKRYGEPIEIAYGIIYFLSDASAWVTGQSLIIDGGVTI